MKIRGLKATSNRSSNIENRKIVSRDEVLGASQEHLAKEKQFRRLRDQLSRQRRELPWVIVGENYIITFLLLRKRN